MSWNRSLLGAMHHPIGSVPCMASVTIVRLRLSDSDSLSLLLSHSHSSSKHWLHVFESLVPCACFYPFSIAFTRPLFDAVHPPSENPCPSSLPFAEQYSFSLTHSSGSSVSSSLITRGTLCIFHDTWQYTKLRQFKQPPKLRLCSF